jgi:hypothetical protein
MGMNHDGTDRGLTVEIKKEDGEVGRRYRK